MTANWKELPASPLIVRLLGVSIGGMVLALFILLLMIAPQNQVLIK